MNLTVSNPEEKQSVLQKLNQIARELEIDESVVDKAFLIYRGAFERGLDNRNRGSFGLLITACLYAACRITGNERSLKDFASATTIKKKDIARFYRALYQELDLSIPVADPSMFLPGIAAKFGFSEKTQKRAYHIIRLYQAQGTSGKEPIITAAASLYVANMIEKERMTTSQKEVTGATSVSEITFGKRCREMKILLNIKEKFYQNPRAHQMSSERK